ncbi:hypothetical protein TNCV_2125921 [Trichonephila clavipes]|nr:hypothetical protein TNCV_2125921 [Trichonephila clavipes]
MLNLCVFLYSPCLFRLFVCFRFSSGLHEKGKRNKYRCGQRTVRLAVVASSKARSLRAQAQQIKTETKTFEKRERKTEVREQALPSSHHGNQL